MRKAVLLAALLLGLTAWPLVVAWREERWFFARPRSAPSPFVLKDLPVTNTPSATGGRLSWTTNFIMPVRRPSVTIKDDGEVVWGTCDPFDAASVESACAASPTYAGTIRALARLARLEKR